MIFDLIPYLLVFVMSAILIVFAQKLYNLIINDSSCSKRFGAKKLIYYMFVLSALFPLIAMFGLRYGIGVDYFNYEKIYNALHGFPFPEYWGLFLEGTSVYYVEPGYFFVNQLFSSYRLLLWGIGLIVFILVAIAIKDYVKKMSFGFAILIFWSIQWSHFITAMRFTIALCIVLVAFKCLAEGKCIKYIIIVLIAALFHKTALICLPMFFLKNYKNNSLNYIRKVLLVFFVIAFPLFAKYVLDFVSHFNFASRYFSTDRYSVNGGVSVSWTIILHLFFSLGPLIIFARKELLEYSNTSILFRICILDFPFRVLGFYNSWITRIARYPSIAQVLLVPLVVSRIQNKKSRIVLYVYYVCWYLFNFGYYELVNNMGTSLPYESVISCCL